MTHDPTYGRIDADIQAFVERLEPRNLGERVAMENTLQFRRDSRGTESHQHRLARTVARLREEPKPS